MINFILNEKDVSTDLPPGTVLLDFIRYHRQLKGTKIGCREGDCGACTVLAGSLEDGGMRYRSVTSCLMPVGNANGLHIVTVEGINMTELNPVQLALQEEGATQCGFCTPGFVISLAGYCLDNKEVTEQNAMACMDGNICRCTGYKSLERAAKKINELMKGKAGGSSIDFVTEKKILPAYFSSVPQRLRALQQDVSAQPGSSPSGQEFRYVSGGTDLYVKEHDAMTLAGMELLAHWQSLKGINREGNRCTIGASATVTDLNESAIIRDHFPAFASYAKLVSSTPIRNMATLAGNIVNASPIGDLTIFFLALDAVVILNGGGSRREVPLRNFYRGYKTLDKMPQEIIERISFDLPGENTHFNFEKVSKRTHLDIASVNTAMQITISGETVATARISAGGVGPVPLYLEKASAYLAGKRLSAETIRETIRMAQGEISPISDTRGSAAYKRLLLSQLIKAHFIELFPSVINVEEILSM